MRHRIAILFTVLGHPLILGTAYVIVMAIANLPADTAILLSFLVIGLIALPITIHNLRKLKKGAYSNFDVSDQNQRKGFYPFAISLFILLILIFYLLEFPKGVLLNTGNFLVMLLAMALVNLKIKASLHAAIAIYAGISIFSLSSVGGLSILALAMATTWSRLELKKHKSLELALGSMMGLFFGIISLKL